MACKTKACSGTDPWCQFCAPAASSVTLTAVGTVGSIKFASARYDGVELVGGAPVSSVTLAAIKTGRSVLTAAYVFSRGVDGEGELHEQCTASTTKKLDDLFGDDGLRRHKFCGEQP